MGLIVFQLRFIKRLGRISIWFDECLIYAYEQGTLSVSQRREIIKLTLKKDADPHFIKHWRPLTLLNCDCKIATKAIANRIRRVIPKLINDDQKGFLKGRFIGENIILIDSIIHYAADQPLPECYFSLILKKL